MTIVWNDIEQLNHKWDQSMQNEYTILLTCNPQIFESRRGRQQRGQPVNQSMPVQVNQYNCMQIHIDTYKCMQMNTILCKSMRSTKIGGHQGAWHNVRFTDNNVLMKLTTVAYIHICQCFHVNSANAFIILIGI